MDNGKGGREEVGVREEKKKVCALRKRLPSSRFFVVLRTLGLYVDADGACEKG